MYDHKVDPLGDVILSLRNPNNAPLILYDPLDDAAKPKTAKGDRRRPRASSHHPVDKPVTFLVSSRHLILASPVFKAMLKGGWDEGNKKDGVFRIDAEDWDVMALTIVMDVLHSHYRQVPKWLTLKSLVKIAIIVDYYKLHEALQPMTLLWMKSIDPGLPIVSFRPDDVLRIFVSWVFGYATAFTEITKAAILWSEKDVEFPEGIPIPPAVVDRINQCRKESFNAIATGLHGLQQDYTEGREGCSFECSAMHLGALTKNMHDLNLSGHSPETPFGDASLVEVVDRIKTMKPPIWHTLSSPGWYQDKRTWRQHQCTSRGQSGAQGIESSIGNTTITKETSLANLPALLSTAVKDKIEGLQLGDIKSDSGR
ncbi:uncharacterized protein B0H64DRAFT_100393 [Chaetomium fimeti]|jgi:hypothetical protein|uniref:BTB domain-containing protein n=1 Tax=Chaetomium fimeti TaxID=1854472 RepID=A0AAE0HMV9_9PEZI|nr:hypothetical protein B0H64DRAFT_100393 [Chaetomium fimeti]